MLLLIFLISLNKNICFKNQVSDGGVHAHIDHLFAMIEAAKQAEVPNTFVQFFSDGRDTRPTSGGKWYMRFT